ncbi:hypothetical protein EYF80_012768 [Liparis tanakae]|uniref:Uncharacterized protein n=1 Tax=Liparis tanakae TaxID=230148 RepID=A0A4Z2IHX1_9TELE|nr:hypothetical protein EYF80_012768 [Liparis tanakae]
MTSVQQDNNANRNRLWCNATLPAILPHSPQCHTSLKVGLPSAPRGNKSPVRVAAQRCQILGCEKEKNKSKR